MAKLTCNVQGFPAIYVNLSYVQDGTIPVGNLYMMKPKFKVLCDSLWRSLTSKGHTFYTVDHRELKDYSEFAAYIHSCGYVYGLHQFLTEQTVNNVTNTFSWRV